MQLNDQSHHQHSLRFSPFWLPIRRLSPNISGGLMLSVYLILSLLFSLRQVFPGFSQEFLFEGIASGRCIREASSSGDR
jgi:hypothetical protein